MLAPDTKTSTVVSAKGLSLIFQTNQGRCMPCRTSISTIGKGEFVSFIGPSGCGKTTFLRVIADLEQPTSGTISVNGMTPEEARKLRAYGYVFQAPALYPWRTVEKNVALPLEIMGFPTRTSGRSGSRGYWTSSISAASAKNFPGSCRAACSSAPRSRGRSPSTPTCC